MGNQGVVFYAEKIRIGQLSPGYCEYLVWANAGKNSIIIRILTLIFGIALFVAFASLFNKIPQVLFLWCVVVIGIVVIVFNKTKREFEYTIAQGTFTADVIYGKSFRKKYAEVKISDVVKVMPVFSKEYLDYFNGNKFSDAKTIYACGKKEHNMYFMHVKGAENIDKIIYFGGCDKLIDCIKYYNRSCVVVAK